MNLLFAGKGVPSFRAGSENDPHFLVNVLQQGVCYLILLLVLGCGGTADEDGLSGQHDVAVKDVAASDTAVSQKNQSEASDSLQEYTEGIQRNDSFYRIFERLGVDPQRIYTLTSENEELLDRFDMKPGQSYRYTLHEGDSTSELYRLVWEPNHRDFLVFRLYDTLSVVHQQKKVDTRIATASDKIESSLYQTFIDGDMPLELAFKLSDLYAWEIDFFLLRSGDAFKVVYEELFVEGERIGIGDIIAAEFRHRDESYKAYLFYNGSDTGYYDPEGKSLQKALLKAPLKFRYISSGYSHSRYHPILRRRMPHYGIDYVAPRGTPVVSVGDGKVLTARYKGANGNMVKIRHNSTYTTTYIHLSRFAEGIRGGTRVKQGDVIGYVGNTGRSTGSHLDYRLYKNGTPVNPRKVELPPTDGIAESHMSAFKHTRKKLDQVLDRLSWEASSGKPAVTHTPSTSNSDEGGAGKNS